LKLTEQDLKMFNTLGIPQALVEAARIERVDDHEAREYGFTNCGDMRGIVFPYFVPSENGHRVTARLRRDHPEIENGKPKKKYVSPYGDRRHLYFPPGARELIADLNVPIALIESEKAALALLAWSERVEKKILPVGLGGCWGWRGRIGKAETPDGVGTAEVGPLPDLACCSDGRIVYVLLDANAASNADVKTARAALVKQLKKQKAKVKVLHLPAADGVNGPDDFIGLHGDEAMLAVIEGKASQAANDAIPEQFSEDAIALRFADAHRDSLRFTSATSRWNEWQGTHWNQDRTLRAFDLARAICRAVASEVDDEKNSLRCHLTSARTVAAVEKLARADRQLAAVPEQWDREPFLLATPAGTIDLHTGESRPNRAGDYITRVTAVAPSPRNSLAPEMWLRFLNSITSGDSELEEFLQRMYGYSLTADVSEEALFFFYGAGFNGKSTYVNTITGAMGSYYKPASTGTFMAHAQPQHPCDIADLWGARLVSAVETSEGQYWDESRIKMLTGRDPQKGRFMRSNPSEFMPTQKFVIMGNHRPRLRIVDKAIAGRLHIVPFLASFLPDSPERVKDMEERLKPEWPAVLRWGIEGCLQWQERGLDPPSAVREASAEYLEGEDALGRWLDECCELKPAFTATHALHSSFKRWGEHANEAEAKWSERKLSDELSKRIGLRREKRWNGFKQERGFLGVCLLGERETDE
jgi:putative DNA primase/helicase